MGYNLVTEILNYAPTTLTPKEMVAALAFAADANDGTRLTWNSVEDPMFLRQLRVGRARLYELLDALVAKGVLVLVSAGHRHGCAKYRFVVLDPSQCPETPDTEAPPKCPGDPDTEGGLSVQVSRTLNHDQCPGIPDISVRDSRTPTSQYQSVLSPVTTRSPDADPNGDGEREPVFDGTPMPNPADPIVQAWIDSWAKTQQGIPHPVNAPNAVRRSAQQLLAEGLDPELLRLAAADMARHGWKNLAQHLEHYTPPATQLPPGTTARTVAECHWCDPFGWYEHTNGDEARCPHSDNPPAGHPAATDARSAA